MTETFRSFLSLARPVSHCPAISTVVNTVPSVGQNQPRFSRSTYLISRIE